MTISAQVLAAIIQDRGTAFVDPRLKSSIAKLVQYEQSACMANPTTDACETILYKKRQINSTINFELDCQLRQYGSLSVSGMFYPTATGAEVTLLFNELRDRVVASI